MEIFSGKQVADRRKALGMSRTQLGVYVGVTERTIRNWELDHKTPMFDSLPKLATALTCRVGDLFITNVDDNS